MVIIIHIGDMMGKKVLQGDLSASNAINVYGLSSGVYMLKLNESYGF